LSPEVAQWPASKKLQVVSGLDLLTEKGQEGLEKEMKEKVKGIETVTHVYFFGRFKVHQLQGGIGGDFDLTAAYIMDPDPDKEIAINVKLLDRAVKAVEHLSPNLKFIVLPTGTKVRNYFNYVSFNFTDNCLRHMEFNTSTTCPSLHPSRNPCPASRNHTHLKYSTTHKWTTSPHLRKGNHGSIVRSCLI
jgi:hypothetical protein